MSFEKNLRRFSRALPPTPPPPRLRNRVVSQLPSPAPSFVSRFTVARVGTARKSAASRADRPVNARPVLSERGCNALRVTGRVALGTTILATVSGSLWWHNANRVPVINIPATHVISPNGYADLLAATRKMVPGRDAQVNRAIGAIGPVPGTKVSVAPPTRSEKTALLVENAAALRAVRDALPRPAQVPPRRNWSDSYPELQTFRQMARLFALEGLVHEEKKQYAQAANSYLNAMELGERTGQGGALIDKFDAIACESIGRRFLAPLSDKLSPAESRAVIQRLEALQARRVSIADCLSEEKWLMQTELNQRFRQQNLWQIASDIPTDYMVSNEYQEYQEPGKNSFWARCHRTLLLMRYGKNEIADANQRYMDTLIACAKLPYDRTRPSPALPPDYLNQVLCPLSRAIADREADVQAQNTLLTGKLAIEAYRQETGRIPQSWKDLVRGGYVRAVPVDPFAKNGTDHLHYVRTAPGKSPAGYLLYSVGPDGVDNAGTPMPVRERNWTSRQDNGDFVLGVNWGVRY